MANGTGHDGAKIPQHVVDAVRASVDLVALVSRTVALKRSGRALVGLCPFHEERHPSLNVTPGRGWYCFGCGEGGTSIEWVQKTDRVDFPTAVRSLAASCGVAVDDDARPIAPAPRSTSSRGGRTLPVHRVGVKPRPAESDDAEPREAAPSRPGPRVEWSPDLPAACAAALWSDDGAEVRAYLTTPRSASSPASRGLSDDAVREFGLGALLVRDDAGKVVERWLTIPVNDRDGRPVTVRLRVVPGPCPACAGSPDGCARCDSGRVPEKPKFRSLPGRPLPLFGADRLSADKDATVVVAEGELDVVALWDLGMRENVVSGTAGAGTFVTKDEWLDELEPYRHFALAYDADDAGDAGAAKLGAKLGPERCVRVKLPRKDAGDCLAERVDRRLVERAFALAKPLLGAPIVSIASYEEEIETALGSPETLIGLPTGSAKLDRCLGGDRPGLTVVTGDTSSGKTTFCCWQSWERARVGVPVLVTAFEQSPRGVAEKMLRMQVGGDFAAASPAERRAAWVDLGQMPIHVVAHHGRLAYDDLVATIRYAVRRLGVRCVLVDHLGYVQDADAKDERRDIDRIVQGLALLSAELGVCLWLVAHPTGQNIAQQRRVQMGDLKGASSIKQEAFVVAVVERNAVSASRPHPSSTVHLDKVRAEWGLPGSSCWLAFDPESCRYADDWQQTPQGARRNGAPPPVVPGTPIDGAVGLGSPAKPPRRVRVVREGDVEDAPPSVPADEPRGSFVPTDESGVPY